MSKLNKLTKTSKLLEWYLKYAENLNEQLSGVTISAQPADIEKALMAAGLWEKSDDVAKLLNVAGVSNDEKVNILINVNNKLNVTFTVLLDPTNATVAKKLQQLLENKFAIAMKEAIKKAGLSVDDVITLKWLTF
jgi:hypothetical protein